MKDTQSAIATLQAFVNTQQPLLDILKEAIAYLQGQYDQAINAGDLKNALDQVTNLTTDKETITKSLEAKDKEIADLKAAQVEPVEEPIETPVEEPITP